MPDFAGIPEQLTGSLQENVLVLVSTSDEHCKLVTLNVPLGLYSNRVMRDLATQVYNYVHLYGTAPKEHLVDLVEDKLAGEDGEMLRTVLENIHALQQAGFNERFVVNQLTKFVRQQHLKGAVVEILEATEKGDTDRATDVMDAYRKISYEQFSPGLKLKEYVAEMGKIDRTLPLMPLGIPELDRAELGPARAELHVMLAPPKRGKTWFLLHVAKQAMLSRLRTVYITLEVSPHIIAGRLMQSFFSMTRRESDAASSGRFEMTAKGILEGIQVEEMPKRLALTSKAGIAKVKKSFSVEGKGQIARLSENLIIQSFPTGQLRLKDLGAYLENLVTFHRFMPDVVLLDYADLMHIDLKQYRLGLGMLYKDLRGLAVERNFALVTASQSNRASLTARTITEGHASEDISKVAIADVVLTYNQTKAEREVQVARLHVAVARNSKDKWSVNISQAYSLGQFCTGSAMVTHRTWESFLPKIKEYDGNDEEEEE